MKLCLVSEQIICYICLMKLKPCLAFSLCLPYVPIKTFWLISLWHLVIAFICIQCCLSASLLNSLWAMLTDFFQRSVHNSHLVFSQFGLWFWSVRAPLGAGLAVCWGPLTSLPQNNTDEKPPSVSNVSCQPVWAGNTHHVTVMYCYLLLWEHVLNNQKPQTEKTILKTGLNSGKTVVSLSRNVSFRIFL